MFRLVMTICVFALYAPISVLAVCSHDPACYHPFLEGPGLNPETGYSNEPYEQYRGHRGYDYYYGHPVIVPGGRYRNDYAPTPDGDPYGPYRDKGPPTYYGYPYYAPMR